MKHVALACENGYINARKVEFTKKCNIKDKKRHFY